MSESKKPSLAIVTLTYNNWDLLENCIASVFKQNLETVGEVEFSITDDGTHDFNYKFVQSTVEKWSQGSRVRTAININESNIGTVASFNRAINRTESDIIVILSADDAFYDNSVLSKVTREFETGASQIITTKRSVCDKSLTKEMRIEPSDNFKPLFKEKNELNLYKYIATKGNIISGASVCFTKKIYDELGGFDENYRLLEDYPFFLKALENNINIKFCDFVSIKYSDSGVSAPVGSSLNPMLKSDFVKLYKRLLESNNLTVFQKRRIFYSKCLDISEKKSLYNILRYLEQFLYSAFKKLKLFYR
ncbi:glycosyltransferase [Echinimonas agarilytica]|uniref:Glycosyltransferase n=1 Tax=Echinimonas agarilytica TaxID=1215918 RepID=A0AA42B884_9GAMM|nr:glycosyltransferase [Echinimonas agarilytica]MCM2680123.1 glycosyltransferase [Echinimonas agarilytica]